MFYICGGFGLLAVLWFGGLLFGFCFGFLVVLMALRRLALGVCGFGCFWCFVGTDVL